MSGVLSVHRFKTLCETVRSKISRAKQALGPVDFEWYPYDTISNFVHIEDLLGDFADLILGAAKREGVIDVGCGDGELSFCFEEQGCDVLAVDHPTPNHNAMRGVRALSRQLGSNVKILEMDLDSLHSLGDRKFGLCIFLGTLYHVKNPFYVLEELARRSRFCIVSTRVARCYPDGAPIPPQWPIAYLLSPDELNRDNSNYWIFRTRVWRD